MLAVRNTEKGKAAAAKLSSEFSTKAASIEVWELDMSVYDSVVAFADRVESLERLDTVVLNAGMWSALDRAFNKYTGHEEVIQVNYLSTCLLALLLLRVARSKRANQPQPTRITFTSSEAASFAKFPERNESPLLPAIDKPGKVDAFDRMCLSKLLGQFFFAKLVQMVPPSVAIVNAASPGSIHDSDFNREFDTTFQGALTKKIMRRMGNTSAVGARVVTDAAVNYAEDAHGNFMSFQQAVPLAPIIYTEQGKKISERLWRETMAELSFANIEGILKDLSG